MVKREQRDRIFVESVKGKYDEIFREIYERPRIIHSKEVPFEGGPVHFAKSVIDPDVVPVVTQSIAGHIYTIAPGGKNAKHGHMNSALMYVLEGKRHEIHDKERIDWQAGDAFIVRNGCVHQHFSTDTKKPARLLVLKSKPLFLFFNLVFQRLVERGSREPAKGWEDWAPED